MQRFAKWNVQNRKAPETIEEALKIALVNRGLETERKRRDFLSPQKPGKISAKEVGISLKELGKAVKRLEKAKSEKEKIIIYGDYDADGVCAAAILWEAMNGAGFDCLPFIPSRFKDGYGLSEAGIERVIANQPKVKLIVTVDNGIVAHKAVKFAKSRNIDVIVTDHHQKDNKTSPSISLIHSTKVSGSGIAWFFAREIVKKFKGGTASEDLLDLVAIGTVADQLPLLEINRSLVKFGIERLVKTKRVGLKALYKMAAISPEDVDTYRIGFMIAPMINAAGRLGDATDALRLLCTRDNSRAYKLALTLRQLNLERQSVVSDTLTLARKSAGSEKILVVSGGELHEGVIGLAASKLVEIFYRPAIVISTKGPVAKASARSIPGFNIIEAIRGVEDLIVEGGGHEMAAGFSISPEKISEFRDKINTKFSDLITEEMLTNKINIDFPVDFSLLNQDLYDSLSRLSPHGVGNPSVIMESQDCEVVSSRTVGGENNHLKLFVANGGVKIDAIGFGLGYFLREIEVGGRFDIAFSIDENIWQGNKSIQLKLKDIKYAHEGDKIANRKRSKV